MSSFFGNGLLCSLLLLPNLVTSQSYGNMTYDKLSFLLTFHEEEFDVDTSEPQNDYIESVLFLPILITALLFLGMIIFQLSLLFRCCCKCMQCMGHDDAPNRDTITTVTKWTEKVSKNKGCLSRSFYALIIICFILAQGIIWSMQHFKEGSDNAIEATSDLKDISISLENSGLELSVQGDIVLNLTQLAIPTCPEAAVVETYASDFETYINDYLDIVGPVPDNLQDLEDFLNDWTAGDADASGYVFNVYLLFVMMTLPVIIAFCLKSKWFMRGSLCCGLVFIHLLLVAFCLYFIALSIMGDFCQAPTDNLIMLAPDSVVEEATYFGTCNGTNPFAEPVTEAYEAVQELEVAVTALTETGGQCEGNTYLLACFPVINDMYTEIDNIEKEMECDPLQQLWGEIVNEATCDNIYTGIFILFWTVLLIFIAYFCLLIISSLIYQYFGEMWRAEDSLKLLEDVNSSSSVMNNGELSSEMVDRTSETRMAWQRDSEDGAAAGTGTVSASVIATVIGTATSSDVGIAAGDRSAGGSLDKSAAVGGSAGAGGGSAGGNYL